MKSSFQLYLRFRIISFSAVLFMGCLKAQVNPVTSGSGKYDHLVWQDEFDYQGFPDASKWSYDTGFISNHEIQYYTANRRDNAWVESGVLKITARNDSMKSGKHLFPVTSARIITLGKKSWTYGRIEVRAKIPSALGTWPAIWTLGADIRQTGWPACGEIDIMENVGFDPDTLHFNVHTKKYNHVIHTNKGNHIYYPSPQNDFHIYAIEWFPERIDWYFDDRKVFTFTNEGSGVAAWPFDKPQFVILNLAFGGDWGGAKGVAYQSLPQVFEIDYVRVYQ